MKTDKNDKMLDELIGLAITRERPKLDFDKWKDSHKKEIENFNMQSRQMSKPVVQFYFWRTIMKSKITKLTAAAVIIVGAFGVVNFLGGPNMTNVALADVTGHFSGVDYVHCYYFKSRGDNFIRHFEGWYSHGKFVLRGNAGDMTFDDGKTQQGFDEQGNRTFTGPSFFAKGQTLFEVFSGGLLSDENEQFKQQMPTNVGEDFLIYEFDPPAEEPHSEWIDNVSITVGRNSLLPVQMKVYDKSGDYDLIIFDYAASEKPPEFFESPEVAVPNAKEEVLLDGGEVVIDIEGSPGLKEAIVRLHNKYDGPSEKFPSDYIQSDRYEAGFIRAVTKRLRKNYKKKGGPIFRLEVAFITNEGYRSRTNDLITLWLNEAKQCGVGSEDGEFDNWPDGKFRNIRFSPMLKATDKNNTYIVEIRCWIKSKDD